jgi:hypothetical protein
MREIFTLIYMKTIIKLLSIGLLLFLIQDCKAQKVDVFAFKNPKDQSVICRIKNNDTLSYYIPNDPFVCDLQDTLFVEAVFKRKKLDDPMLHYIQFNPPQIDEIKPGQDVIKKIDYKPNNRIIDFSFLAVRIYTQRLDSNVGNTIEYHSYPNFVRFEQTHSFIIEVKIENITKAASW